MILLCQWREVAVCFGMFYKLLARRPVGYTLFTTLIKENIPIYAVSTILSFCIINDRKHHPPTPV